LARIEQKVGCGKSSETRRATSEWLHQRDSPWGERSQQIFHLPDYQSASPLEPDSLFHCARARGRMREQVLTALFIAREGRWRMLMPVRLCACCHNDMLDLSGEVNLTSHLSYKWATGILQPFLPETLRDTEARQTVCVTH